MKLILCLECTDIIRLTKEYKTCDCGKCGGKYTDDINAVYFGNAQPIGIGNTSLLKAIKLQEIENREHKNKPVCCEGVPFNAFCIPENATTLKKIEKEK